MWGKKGRKLKRIVNNPKLILAKNGGKIVKKMSGLARNMNSNLSNPNLSWLGLLYGYWTHNSNDSERMIDHVSCLIGMLYFLVVWLMAN